jgi:hypothetical protein
MNRPTSLILILTWLACLGLAACGDNQVPETPTPPADAAVDADPSALAPCLDRPTDVARPATGALPCDLLPPGFVAPRP